jgi:hypothetical protein
MKKNLRSIKRLPKYPDGGKYNQKRADELGYKPDDTGHLPSVDHETGMWLKSKEHPTAWMEYLYGHALNPELNRTTNVVVNPEGYFGNNQLQYVPKLKSFADGGPTNPFNVTSADSAAIYQNALDLERYYNNLVRRGFYKTPTRTKGFYRSPEGAKEEMDQIKRESLNTYKEEWNRFKKLGRDSNDYKEYIRQNKGKTVEDYQRSILNSIKETMKGNSGRYYYKDLLPADIDTEAPSTLYHIGIEPEGEITYEWPKRFQNRPPDSTTWYDDYPTGGSITKTYYYDKNKIKPYYLRTPAERKELDKKYLKENPNLGKLNKTKPTVNSSLTQQLDIPKVKQDTTKVQPKPDANILSAMAKPTSSKPMLYRAKVVMPDTSAAPNMQGEYPSQMFYIPAETRAQADSIEEAGALKRIKLQDYMRQNPGAGSKSSNYRKAYGGYLKNLPKYANGIITTDAAGNTAFGSSIGGNAGASAIASTAGTLMSLMPDKTVRDSDGNLIGTRPSTGESVGSEALKYASMGAAFGPYGAAAGALVGGTIGLVQANKQKQELEKARLEAEGRKMISEEAYGNKYEDFLSSDFQTNTKSFYEMGGYSDFANYPTTSLPLMSAPNTAKRRSISRFVNGGFAEPNSEIETNELVQTNGEYPMANDGGMLNQANSNTYIADGQTHEQMNANGTTGIETYLPGGSKVFSDRVKHNGRTIASIVAPISKKIGKLETRLEKMPSKALQNTINLLKNQEDYYFNKQEEIKTDKEAARTLQKFALGGTQRSITKLRRKK